MVVINQDVAFTAGVFCVGTSATVDGSGLTSITWRGGVGEGFDLSADILGVQVPLLESVIDWLLTH